MFFFWKSEQKANSAEHAVIFLAHEVLFCCGEFTHEQQKMHMTSFIPMLYSLLSVFIVISALYVLQFISLKMINNSMGWKGQIPFAVVGVPVHELSHSVFCLLCGYRINKLKLFSPDPQSKSLGYVIYTWNVNSPFAIICNFLIGIAPIIFGLILLNFLTVHLHPNGKEIINYINELAYFLDSYSYEGNLTLSFFWEMITSQYKMVIYTVSTGSGWKFWLWLYLVFSISAYMLPSFADLKNGIAGAATIIFISFLLFIAINEILYHIVPPALFYEIKFWFSISHHQLILSIALFFMSIVFFLSILIYLATSIAKYFYKPSSSQA